MPAAKKPTTAAVRSKPPTDPDAGKWEAVASALEAVRKALGSGPHWEPVQEALDKLRG